MHQHSRRDFLTHLLGATFTTGAILEQAVFRAARARAQAVQQTARLFDIEKTAEGVYIALARPAVMLNCNAAIFVNAEDILVVDAHSKPSAVAALVAQIRREVSPKPVRYVVNTHFHYDHVQGTPEYHKLAPEADVLASTTTTKLIEQHSAQRVKASMERIELRVEQARESLGSAVHPAEKKHLERVVAEGQAYLREMGDYVPELPNVTFDENLVIHDKAHELHLVFRGRAHTASDISVFCPQKKVVATADLVVGFIPGMGDGYPREWPATLDRLAQLDFHHVLPGHGDVQLGRRRLLQLKGYIEELNEAVARGLQSGRSADELQQMITPSSLKSLQGEYGEYLRANTEKYRLLTPGQNGAETMAAGVRSNVADSYRLLTAR